MFRSIRGRVDAVLVQAVIAGSLSFSHLHDLAQAAGQDGWKAWAYPISVDLLLVAAWRRMRLLRSDNRAARAAWTWFAIALAASLGANVSTAGLLDLHHVPAWLRILVAGWPALAFLGGTLLAHAPAHAAANEQEPTRQPDPKPAPEIAVTVDRPAPPLPEEPAPELPPAPAPAPEVKVPPALLAHARKLADAHRATNGSPITTETLRAQLGIPPQLADAITTQLA